MSKFSKHFRMEKEDAMEYAVLKLDIFDKGAVLNSEEIGDGNINYVFRVWDVNTKKSVIIKHADILLRSSGRPLDIDRNRIEAEALAHQGKYAPNLVPKIYKYDSVMCILAMEDISDHGNLRTELLKRKIFPHLADDITTFMVNTLLPTTDLIMDSSKKKDVVCDYINKDLCKISEDLVFTEPYIDYKGRNIIFDGMEDFVRENIYNDQALILEAGKLKNNFMNNAQALLHGDLHSGSIFVKEDSTMVLDPEFAFYGPIGYDLGNVIGNLFFSLGNAVITEEKADIDIFAQWLTKTIEDVVDTFKEKFIKLYINEVTDIMAKEELYMNWYLNSVLSDAAGSAGLEIIRRVIGDSKVQDITAVTDKDKRKKLEKLLILTGKELIINRDKVTTGKDYTEIFSSKI